MDQYPLIRIWKASRMLESKKASKLNRHHQRQLKSQKASKTNRHHQHRLVRDPPTRLDSLESVDRSNDSNQEPRSSRKVILT